MNDRLTEEAVPSADAIKTAVQLLKDPARVQDQSKWIDKERKDKDLGSYIGRDYVDRVRISTSKADGTVDPDVVAAVDKIITKAREGRTNGVERSPQGNFFMKQKALDHVRRYLESDQGKKDFGI